MYEKKFIVRTKGFEDEVIILKEESTEVAVKDTQPLTYYERVNLLFNNALAIALNHERSMRDSYILLDGCKPVAMVKQNKIYYMIDKPKYLYLLQRKLR